MRRLLPAALLLATFAVLCRESILTAFQGMGTSTHSARPANIQTNLPPIQVDFRDVAEDAGLRAINVNGGNDVKKYILETTGNGVAIFDMDNDGLMDVFIVNGTTMDGKGAGENATSHLYRNLGKLRFEDVTAKSGLGRTGWGQGVCAGDYDNDGRRDLFVTYYGHSVLYHNEGGGTFRDVTQEAGLSADAVRWDTGCSFFDYDLDGKLDLVLTGYVEFDPSRIPEPGASSNCQWKGMPVMCGPRGLPPGRNLLFHNKGNGRFEDVSAASGIGKPAGCYGFTVISSDFDNDGFPDLYVTCDSRPSLMYHNRKNGTFEEIGILSGTALNEDGQEQAGMGAAVADYDEDGYPDILKTNFSEDTPNLYHNLKDGTFSDDVYTSGLGVRNQYLGWGAHFLDVDHDGRKDILLINGHVYPEVDRMPLGAKFRQPRLLYWNVGGGKFKDLSNSAGAGVSSLWSSRGSAAGDLDNDGGLEVVVNNLGDRPSLLKNFGKRKNWLLVECRGTKCNRDAVGARAYVFVGDRRLSGEVQTGTSFLSQNDSRLHFGLGDDASYRRIEVRWPGGEKESFPGGAANRIVTVEQGKGTRAPR
ncbi:MAG TPA: CRTAC1 family protein, partial [Candidatus Limnocylindria bacterium]|nr:CRTAC1 family protein [Candidatus Limnocylindria bacterium]